MNMPDHDAYTLLDAFVDDQLTGAQRASFEASLQDDDTLRAHFHQQQAIDDALRRRLGPPDEAVLRDLCTSVRELAGSHAQAEAPQRESFAFPLRRYGLAAAVIMLIIGGVLILRVLPQTGQSELPQRTMAAAYANILDKGFQPDWVCEDDDEFGWTFYSRFRQRLLYDAAAAGVAVSGISLTYTFSPHTLMCLAEVDGTPVIVFVDRAENAHDPAVDESSGLNVYTRRIGDLMLYEVSPLDTMQVLPGFYDPDADAPRDPETGESV
jgi:hypothetical protein